MENYKKNYKKKMRAAMCGKVKGFICRKGRAFQNIKFGYRKVLDMAVTQ